MSKETRNIKRDVYIAILLDELIVNDIDMVSERDIEVFTRKFEAEIAAKRMGVLDAYPHISTICREFGYNIISISEGIITIVGDMSIARQVFGIKYSGAPEDIDTFIRKCVKKAIKKDEF